MDDKERKRVLDKIMLNISEVNEALKSSALAMFCRDARPREFDRRWKARLKLHRRRAELYALQDAVMREK